MSKQEQKSGDQSVNVMIGTVTSTGLTYSDAKELFLDLFKANFPSLQQMARDTAEERAKVLIEKYVDKLSSEHPQGLDAAKDPDMQYAILSAQKAYARSGNSSMGDLLVDILIERTKRDKDELKRIVLNESIEVAHKLTESQINAMTISFLFGYTVNQQLNSLDALKKYLLKFVKPFCSGLTRHRSDYQHLVYAGCGTISIGSKDLHRILTEAYQAIFVKGFDKTEIADIGLTSEQEKKILIQCLRDSSKLQLNSINEDVFEKTANEIGLNDGQKTKLRTTNRRVLSADALKNDFIQIDPIFKDLFECWEQTDLKSLDLTSVGIAISIANIKKTTGINFDLNVWIK